MTPEKLQELEKLAAAATAILAQTEEELATYFTSLHEEPAAAGGAAALLKAGPALLEEIHRLKAEADYREPRERIWPPPRPDEVFAAELSAVVEEIEDMLVAKNRAYGNSALDPIRIFSKADPVEQLLVRLDDKLSRLVRGTGEEREDVEADALGYLLLLRIARRRQAAGKAGAA